MLSRKETFRLGLGILISAAALAGLLWVIDLREVLQALRAVDLRYFAPILTLTVISFWTRAAGWQTILPVQIQVWKVFLYINAGYLLNTIFPLRMGEVGRAFMLKPSGLDFWEAIPTIVLERIFDFLLAASLFLGALPFILQIPQGTQYAVLVVGMVLVGLSSLYLLVRHQKSVLRWVSDRKGTGGGWVGWIEKRLRSFLSGLDILADPARFFRAFLWMFLSWMLAWGYQYLLLRAFFPQAKLLWAAFALGAVALGISLPSSPGNIGVYEASMVAALLVFGLDQSTAFGYAIVSHVLNLSMTTIFGSFALVHEGFELRKMLQYGETQKEEGEK